MPRRGENIYRRRDGRWEGRYIRGRKENGRADYASVYGASYADVRAKLTAKRNAVKAPPAKTDRMTVKDLFALWLESRRAKVKPSSYARYRILLDTHILPQLGNVQASELTAKKLEAFIEHKLSAGRLDGGGGLSRKTVNDIVAVIKSGLKLARGEHGISDLGVFDVKAPGIKQGRIETFGDCESELISEIVARAPDIPNVAYLLCLNTGLRLGEVCALKWSDIDFRESTLRVCRTVLRIRQEQATVLSVQTPKSERSEREIPLTAEMLALISRFRGNAPADAFILTGSGRPMEPRTMQYRFKSFLQRYNFRPRNFHALRHSFATRCVARGADAKTLSELLGHANVKTTLQLYVHPSMEQKRSYIQLASTFSGKRS